MRDEREARVLHRVRVPPVHRLGVGAHDLVRDAGERQLCDGGIRVHRAEHVFDNARAHARTRSRTRLAVARY